MSDLKVRFEEWMSSSNYPEIADIALARLPNGNYKSQLTHAAWQGWQAGYREAAAELARLRAPRNEAVALADAASEIEVILPNLRAEHYRIRQVLEQALRAIKWTIEAKTLT